MGTNLWSQLAEKMNIELNFQTKNESDSSIAYKIDGHKQHNS